MSRRRRRAHPDSGAPAPTEPGSDRAVEDRLDGEPGPASEPPRLGSDAPRPRWRSWLGRGLLGLVGGGLAIWAAVNAVHDDAPVPLWGAASLPEPPADEDNGWQALFERPGLFGGVDTGPVDDAVRAALDAPDGRPLPSSAELAIVREALGREPLRQAWVVCEASLAAPEFVDSCPLDFEQRCPAIDLLECHRVGGARALAAAAEGRWSDAAAELDRLLRQALAVVRTARSVVTAVAGYQAMEQTLRLARRVGEAIPAAKRAKSFETLHARLTALDDEDLAFLSAAIGEYLVAVHGLERMAKGEFDRGGPALPGFFLDPGATLAELNRIYAPVARVPEGLVIPDLPRAPYTAPVGWWFRNPLGKLYLDVVLPPRRAFEQLLVARERLLVARDAARRALAPTSDSEASDGVGAADVR